MNKNIYANSDEKFVKATVLFASDDKIYYNEEHTEEVALEDALNLFKKGLMLVSVDGGFKRPTGITVTEDGYTISYGGEGGGSGSVVPDTEGEEANNVPVFDGNDVKWRDLITIAMDTGYVLAPIPTAGDDGFVLAAGSNGSVSWRKVSSLT